MSRIGVVGGGTMGNGIAHVFAQFGHDTTLVDVTQDALDRAKATIEKNLGRQVKKEKISEDDMKSTLGRMRVLHRGRGVGGLRLVVEAIFENLEAKTNLYREIVEHVGDGHHPRLNTSSISITKLATATGRPIASSACTS